MAYFGRGEGGESGGKGYTPNTLSIEPHASGDTTFAMAPTTTSPVTPSHPDLIKVVRSPEAFASGAVSLVSLPAGAHFVDIMTATPAPCRYTSVQDSVNTHAELNSDLIFCNHSCAPTIIFDMGKLEVRVVENRALKKGDPLTFFYPSTEWDMAQPFECNCGAPENICKGWISGAKNMKLGHLEGYWLNDHIVRLLAQREAMEGGPKEGKTMPSVLQNDRIDPYASDGSLRN